MPRFLPHIDRALKAMRMRWSGYGGSGLSSRDALWFDGRLPGSNIRWEEKAGDLWLNSVAAAAMTWMADNLNEAEVGVGTRKPGAPPDMIPGHGLTALLQRPNEDSCGSDLWAASVLSHECHGNTYWLKGKSYGSYGKTGALFWVPPWQVRPCWPDSGREFISHYEYQVDGQWTDVDKKDVVHIRNGHDPQNPRLGLAPLFSALRQVVGDNEGATYMAAILINTGMPSAIVSPDKAAVNLTSDQAKDLKSRFKRHFTGDRRGDVLVQTVPLKWEKTAWSPQELALDTIFHHFESRICALLKISPMVLGLQVGLENSTYSNMDAAQRAAYLNCVIPLQCRFAEALNYQLLPEFGDPQTQTVHFDVSRVWSLAEDQNEVAKRLSDAVGGPYMTPNEARAQLGLPAIAGGEKLYPPKAAAPAPGENGKEQTRMERKSIPFEIKATSEDGGSFEGYGSVFGNSDSGWDIVDPGFFAGTLDYFLAKGIIALYHDWSRPIGKPTKAVTDARGLLIAAKLSDVPDARDCRTLMKDGIIQSLSMGYGVTQRMWLDGKSDVEEYWRSISYNPTPDDLEAAAYGARVLMKGKLYEVSPVPFPMNDRCDITSAKAAPHAGRTLDDHSDLVRATCEEFIERVKGLAAKRQAEGRDLSPERRALLKRLRDGFDALLQEAEPKADAADIDTLWLQFQETQARLAGVTL